MNKEKMLHLPIFLGPGISCSCSPSCLWFPGWGPRRCSLFSSSKTDVKTSRSICHSSWCSSAVSGPSGPFGHSLSVRRRVRPRVFFWGASIFSVGCGGVVLGLVAAVVVVVLVTCGW